MTSVEAVWPAADVTVTVVVFPVPIEDFWAWSCPFSMETWSPVTDVVAARVLPDPPVTVNAEVLPPVFPARMFSTSSPEIARVSSTLTVMSIVLDWPYAVSQVTVTVWFIPTAVEFFTLRTPSETDAPLNEETVQILVEESDAVMEAVFSVALFL